MKDDAKRPKWPKELPEADDEIEILEVVGMDEDAPPPGDSEPDDIADADERDEVVLSFDGADDPAAAGDARGTALAEQDEDRDATRERLLRLQADFENLRKRVERERDDYHRYATATLISRLLPVLDNFERALASDGESERYDPFRDGISLIYRQLVEELQREGLHPVEAVGEAFDPERHEAVATDASSDEPPNRVLEEFQRGYFFQDRLLRPARVKVSVDARLVEPDGAETEAAPSAADDAED